MEGIFRLLNDVREKKPIVHHLTNSVTAYDCANIVKVFGGSPVMTNAIEESEDMTNIASALVLNIGTLSINSVELMKKAGKAANIIEIPVVLDVCGVGATSFRDRKAIEILNSMKVDVIKGNASEILRVSGMNVKTKGVDSTDVSVDLISVAKKLALERNCTVVITAKEDIVSDGKRCFIVRNGNSMMQNVVGTGCMATSVIGAFAAVTSDYAIASASGLCCYEIAAEIASKKATGPGTFKEMLFDEVFKLDELKIKKMQKVESCK